MIDDDSVELTGDQFLDIVQEQVVKDYLTPVTDRWLEQDNETKQVSAIFQLQDKIGVVKVLVQAEIE